MSYIHDIFGTSGILARHFDAYEMRSGQVGLAEEIDAAFTDGVHLLAEGPTGTGKAIAYSVPASFHASTLQKRVLIVTANIALQEQLCYKDLPLLQEILPWKFTYELMKGKGNYLCKELLNQEVSDAQPELAPFNDGEHRYLEIRHWARHTKTGDISELGFQPSRALWSRFSVASQRCKAGDCQFRDECFAYAARERAEVADIVVSNYHMLLIHLLVREATGMDIVLPPFDLVVCDEGHKAPDIARDFLGFRIMPRNIRWIGRRLRGMGERDLGGRLIFASEEFFAELAVYRESPAYSARIKEPNVVGWRDVTEHLVLAQQASMRAMARAKGAEERRSIRRVWQRASMLAEQIQSAMTLEDADTVTFIDEFEEEPCLRTKAIEVGQRIRKLLFDSAKSVVVTSATLSTNKRFEYIASEFGLEEPRIVVGKNPFDHRSQSLLVVPEGMPGVNDDAFPEAVAKLLCQVVELAHGRTLGLFTSYKNLEEAHDALIPLIGYRVLKQGEMARTALIEEFRRDVDSVLLGTDSFWAGVDVPGEALSCVVIDKLPFPNPDDPIVDAIRSRDTKWFFRYALPRAIIAFRQGVGRLIRKRTDRGVVVVLDERIVTKGYGRLFLKSLPDGGGLKTRDLLDIRHFLEEGPR